MSNQEHKVEYPDVDWENILPKLPLDDNGYVQSFEIIMATDDEKSLQQNKQAIQAFFNKYGVVVIRNILDEKEADVSCDELFDYVEKNVEGLDRNDPNTWDKIQGLSAKLGMITDWPIMSSQMVKNRINPKLYTAYSYILDTDIHNLYTNIGRIGWMRPTMNIKFSENKIEDRVKWKTTPGTKWLHLDYDPLSNHCTTYGLMPRKDVKDAKIDRFDKVRTQGILALDDCRVSDGGFQCIPGFHNIMKEVWMKEYGELITKGVFQHRYQFSESDPLIKYITKCPLQKGSLLVWNSKLPHNNFSNDSDHGRKVQYIKYARYDDPAVKPVQFGVEQSGPWGFWPLTLEFPFNDVELNEVTKRIYGIGVADIDGEDEKQDQTESEKHENNKSYINCNIL